METQIYDVNVWIKEKQVTEMHDNQIGSNQHQLDRNIEKFLASINDDLLPFGEIDQNKEKTFKVVEKTYLRGTYLGAGAYAKCYEISSFQNKVKINFACKIIEKKKLNDERKKKIVEKELQLHKMLNHEHIVHFKHFFEDEENIYILLELCEQKSMQDLIFERRQLAIKNGQKDGCQGLEEIEVRYFMTQILSALQYLNEKRIVHRDLSMKNIFLGRNQDKTMQIKIGDFGLSILMPKNKDHCLRNSFCGTPQFIAPEIYQSEIDMTEFKYSFKNDIWSLGVIFYTLLTGANPFTSQADSIPHLKRLILDAVYEIPQSNQFISEEAIDLLTQLLQLEPSMRLSVSQILNHPFFTQKPILPDSLPRSTFMRPLNQKEKFEINEAYLKRVMQSSISLINQPPNQELEFFAKQVSNQKEIFQQIQNKQSKEDIMIKLALVSQWVFVEKYGIGYKLRNGNFGIKFKDKTNMFTYKEPIFSHEQQVEQIRDMVSQIPKDTSAQIYFQMGKQFPESLRKHVKIFEKMIKQLKYQCKMNNQSKHEFEEFSDDFQTYVNKSQCHEIIVTNHFINMQQTLAIFKISNLTLLKESESIDKLSLKPNELYQCKFESGLQILISRGPDQQPSDQSQNSQQDTSMNQDSVTYQVHILTESQKENVEDPFSKETQFRSNESIKGFILSHDLSLEEITEQFPNKSERQSMENLIEVITLIQNIKQ